MKEFFTGFLSLFGGLILNSIEKNRGAVDLLAW